MAKNKAEENRDLILTGDKEAKPKKNKKKRSVVKDDPSPLEPVAMKGENYAKPDRRDGHPWRGTGKGNPNHAHIPPEERCGRRKANGEPCDALPIKGSTVCRVHGGSAPQVMSAAMVRLQRSALKLVRAEIAIALDEEEPTAVRLAALRDALDRAGIKSAEKVDIAHSMKPYERVMQGGDPPCSGVGGAHGPRDHRAARDDRGRPVLMAARCALDLPLGSRECSLCFRACDRHPSRRSGRAGGGGDPYADNAPGRDGEVRCRGCRLPFPGLDALRAAGLDRYPVRCRECRARRPGVVAADARSR